MLNRGFYPSLRDRFVALALPDIENAIRHANQNINSVLRVPSLSIGPSRFNIRTALG
jgi:hypothetical protein